MPINQCRQRNYSYNIAETFYKGSPDIETIEQLKPFNTRQTFERSAEKMHIDFRDLLKAAM